MVSDTAGTPGRRSHRAQPDRTRLLEIEPRGDLLRLHLESEGAQYLRNILCFNLAAQLSFGIAVGDVPSTVLHPLLVTAIARDLYLDSIDVAMNERCINAPLVALDAKPYERAVDGFRPAAA